MKHINMIVSLDFIPHINLPEGYKITNITEENAYLWEKVMDKTYDGCDFLSGTFRYVMVSNHYYDENRVFVMLNIEDEPIATATAWSSLEKWDKNDMGEVAFVCVESKYQGNKFGQIIVNKALHELKRRGYKLAHLGVTYNNYSAIKTYINCGFTPVIEEQEDYDIWTKNYSYLSIPLPDNGFKKIAYNELHGKILCMLPETLHPPRPWPYQIIQFFKAITCGKNYVFGYWIRYNMYKVDADVYMKLKEIIMSSSYAGEIADYILENKVQNIYVNRPVTPSSLLLEHEDGKCYLIATEIDIQFTEGIELYFQREYYPLLEKEGKDFKLIKDELYINNDF